MPPYALKTTAVLWRTDGISRLGEVLFITTICPVHHRISNRRASLITRIAEGITQWDSCMKEHTDSRYFHAVPTAKNSFLHCYFREPCPVNTKTLHTHAHITKTLQHEAESLACLLTGAIQAAYIPSWLNAFWVSKQSTCHISIQVNLNLFPQEESTLDTSHC